jgi:copper chaperone
MCTTNTAANDLGLTDKNRACDCAADNHGETAGPVREGAITQQYLVEGMTCSHCVASVTEELSDVAGVESVSVDLNVGGSSSVSVVSSRPVPTPSPRRATRW